MLDYKELVQLKWAIYYKNAKKVAKAKFSKDQLDNIMKKAYELKAEKPNLSMIECISIVLNSMDLFKNGKTE